MLVRGALRAGREERGRSDARLHVTDGAVVGKLLIMKFDIERNHRFRKKKKKGNREMQQ